MIAHQNCSQYLTIITITYLILIVLQSQNSMIIKYNRILICVKVIELCKEGNIVQPRLYGLCGFHHLVF